MVLRLIGAQLLSSVARTTVTETVLKKLVMLFQVVKRARYADRVVGNRQ
jgi:hypothetical protein